MNFELVEKIANAVLYEGYILYPYRPSSVKNQQRWNFGALAPQSYSHAQNGTEAWRMQTQCLVRADEHTALDVKIRFLHLLTREVGRLETSPSEAENNNEPDYKIVSSLEVNGQLFQTWQEAVEREVNLQDVDVRELVAHTKRLAFNFPSSRELEFLREAGGQVVGVIVRTQQSVECVIELEAEKVEARLFKLTVRIENLTAFADAEHKSRDEALMRSLVSTHTILGARGQGSEFVSLLETPEELREVAAACRNVGTWPVLAGEEGARDCLLSSPIILYDYPQIAPESAGNLFDGTEIDEILTLRIMTMTDAEKREMRGVDEHARRILERTETLPAEALMKMHGVMHGARATQKEDER